MYMYKIIKNKCIYAYIYIYITYNGEKRIIVNLVERQMTCYMDVRISVRRLRERLSERKCAREGEEERV